MAVYTEVADDELASFVAGYDIGEVLAVKGIAEGVENSNYLLHTTQGSYILTLYEKRVAVADIKISAEGLIETHDTGGVLRGADERFPAGMFLRSTDLSSANPAMTAVARQLRGEAAE